MIDTMLDELNLQVYMDEDKKVNGYLYNDSFCLELSDCVLNFLDNYSFVLSYLDKGYIFKLYQYNNSLKSEFFNIDKDNNVSILVSLNGKNIISILDLLEQKLKDREEIKSSFKLLKKCKDVK